MNYDTWKETDFEAELWAQMEEITLEDLEAAGEAAAAYKYEEMTNDR